MRSQSADDRKSGGGAGQSSIIARSGSHLLLVAACLFWAGNVIAGRALEVTGPDRVPPALLNGLRWTIALAVLAPFAGPQLSRHWLTIRENWLKLAILGTLGIAGYYLLFYFGVQTVPALQAGLLVGLLPVSILGVAILAGARRPQSRQLAGLAIAVSGSTVVLLSHPAGSVDPNHIGGDAMIVAAVLCWSVYTVLLQRWRISLPPILLLFAVSSIGLLVTVPLITYEVTTMPSTWQMSRLAAGAILYVGLFPAVGSTLCWNMAVREIGADRAGVYMTLIPIFSTALAIVLLGERPRVLDFVCLIIVVSGIFLAASRPAVSRWHGQRRHRPGQIVRS